MLTVEPGRVVVSRAGRDKGRYLVVVGLPQEGFAEVADGRLRKAETPKRKKIRHLQPKPELISSIRATIMGGGRPLNCDLRAELKALYNVTEGDEQHE